MRKHTCCNIVGKIGIGFAGLILALLLGMAFYVLVVMGETTQRERGIPHASMPVRTTHALDKEDLTEAKDWFGAPLLCLPDECGFALEMVTHQMACPEGTTRPVRCVCIVYVREEMRLKVSSYIGLEYVSSLPKRNLMPSLEQTFMLVGESAVYLTNSDISHIHVEADGNVYEIEGCIPLDVMRQIASRAQLQS